MTSQFLGLQRNQQNGDRWETLEMWSRKKKTRWSQQSRDETSSKEWLNCSVACNVLFWISHLIRWTNASLLTSGWGFLANLGEPPKKQKIYDFKGSLKQQPHFQHRPSTKRCCITSTAYVWESQGENRMDSTFFGWKRFRIFCKIFSTLRFEIGEGVCSIHPDILHIYIIPYTPLHMDMFFYMTYIYIDRYVIIYRRTLILANTDMSDGYRHCAIEMRYHPTVLQVHGIKTSPNEDADVYVSCPITTKRWIQKSNHQ